MKYISAMLFYFLSVAVYAGPEVFDVNMTKCTRYRIFPEDINFRETELGGQVWRCLLSKGMYSCQMNTSPYFKNPLKDPSGPSWKILNDFDDYLRIADEVTGFSIILMRKSGVAMATLAANTADSVSAETVACIGKYSSR